jgi:hypothetical protein
VFLFEDLAAGDETMAEELLALFMQVVYTGQGRGGVAVGG